METSAIAPAAVAPTHTVVARWASIRLRSNAVKFAGGSKEAALAAIPSLVRKYGNPSELVIKPLKPVKKSVKVNTQHDYITLTATYPDGVFRLTVSFGGTKVSGDFRGPNVSALLRVVHNVQKAPAAVIENLRVYADKCATGAEFVSNAITAI